MKDIVLDKMWKIKKGGFTIALYNCHNRKKKKGKMGKELRENITREVVRQKMVADQRMLKIKKCLSGRVMRCWKIESPTGSHGGKKLISFKMEINPIFKQILWDGHLQ